jgi:hypothetical protein
VSADDFNSTDRNQRPNAIQILRMPFRDPHHQRAGGVQRDLQLIVGLEHLEEWQVAILVGLFKHTVEISDRLVVVQYQAEMDVMRHGFDFGGRDGHMRLQIPDESATISIENTSTRL